MSCIQLKLEPRDLLFCRDAKPMDGSWIGHGGNWPQGCTFFGSILAALQRFYKVAPQTDKTFSGLQTIGPFPEKDGEIYFPTPLDILPGDGTVPEILAPKAVMGESNLPVPLTKVLWSSGKPTKEEVARWISCSMLSKYLQGKLDKVPKDPELYALEMHHGIAIDPEKRSAEKHKLYTAEYLRLNSGVSLAGFLRLNEMELLEKCFDHGQFSLGGQQCTVFSSCRRETCPLPEPPLKTGTRVKWVLLTPAAWRNGWIPGFLEPQTGKVMLKAGAERQQEESRETWRKRIAELPSIDARLVAARIGKAIPVSGWKMGDGTQPGHPRPTQLLVPAGSVFYFETASPEESGKLIAALSRRCHSDFGGKYGYGLGVCASYQESL